MGRNEWTATDGGEQLSFGDVRSDEIEKGMAIADLAVELYRIEIRWDHEPTYQEDHWNETRRVMQALIAQYRPGIS